MRKPSDLREPVITFRFLLPSPRGSIFIVWSRCMCNYVDVETEILKIGLALRSRRQSKKRVVYVMHEIGVFGLEKDTKEALVCVCVGKIICQMSHEVHKREKTCNFHATAHHNCTINSNSRCCSGISLWHACRWECRRCFIFLELDCRLILPRMFEGF
jgi:hypothetical protein